VLLRRLVSNSAAVSVDHRRHASVCAYVLVCARVCVCVCVCLYVCACLFVHVRATEPGPRLASATPGPSSQKRKQNKTDKKRKKHHRTSKLHGPHSRGGCDILWKSFVVSITLAVHLKKGEGGFIHCVHAVTSNRTVNMNNWWREGGEQECCVTEMGRTSCI